MYSIKSMDVTTTKFHEHIISLRHLKRICEKSMEVVMVKYKVIFSIGSNLSKYYIVLSIDLCIVVKGGE